VGQAVDAGQRDRVGVDVRAGRVRAVLLDELDHLVDRRRLPRQGDQLVPHLLGDRRRAQAPGAPVQEVAGRRGKILDEERDHRAKLVEPVVRRQGGGWR
jgi:hypothetical protein